MPFLFALLAHSVIFSLRFHFLEPWSHLRIPGGNQRLLSHTSPINHKTIMYSLDLLAGEVRLQSLKGPDGWSPFFRILVSQYLLLSVPRECPEYECYMWRYMAEMSQMQRLQRRLLHHQKRNFSGP